MPGSTSWTSRTGPNTLVSKMPRTRSIGSVSIAPISWMPALLTSAPIAPSAASTVSTAARIDSSLLTSSASVLQPDGLEVRDRLRATRGRVDGVAAGGQPLGGRAPDARRAAGDDDGLRGGSHAGDPTCGAGSGVGGGLEVHVGQQPVQPPRQPPVARRPSVSIVVGTSTRRTTVASSAIATASPTPISLICGTPVPAKIANTATMISAALEIVFALAARPSRDGPPVVAGGLVALLDAREHEDLVVHREAEDDRQQQRGRDRLHVAERLEAEEAVEPAPLEDDHEHAVGRGDRQHVHQHRLDRQHARCAARAAGR